MDIDLEQTVVIAPDVLQLIVGFLLPVLVAIVTKRAADRWYKTVTLLFLSIIAGWLTELQQNDGSFQLWPTVVGIIMTFGTAVVSHFGLLQPVHITGSDGVVQAAIPGGIGKGRHEA